MSSYAHVLFSYCQGSSMTCYPWPIAHTVALHTTSERAPGQRQAGDHPVGGDEAGPLSHPVLWCPLWRKGARVLEVHYLNPHPWLPPHSWPLRAAVFREGRTDFVN